MEAQLVQVRGSWCKEKACSGAVVVCGPCRNPWSLHEALAQIYVHAGDSRGSAAGAPGQVPQPRPVLHHHRQQPQRGGRGAQDAGK